MIMIRADVSFGDYFIKFSNWILKMKITINLLPRRKLYALDVYSGVEVILELREGEWQIPLRKDLKIIFFFSQIR
jgi:hypothetical protein